MHVQNVYKYMTFPWAVTPGWWQSTAETCKENIVCIYAVCARGWFVDKIRYDNRNCISIFWMGHYIYRAAAASADGLD